jgi:hypothetical protein
MVPEDIVKWWGALKRDVELFLGLSPDAMHIHMSVVIFVAWTLILRTRYEDWRPWLLTFLVECANEAIDMSQPGGSPEANWDATRHDLINTMIAPTIIMIGARILRRAKKHR